MTTQARSLLKRILLAQCGATLGLVFALVWLDYGAAQSALMGGVICTTANTFAGWRVFSRAESGSAYGELSNFYRAELGKLVMVAALCVAYFAAVKQVNILAFVGGCAAAVAASAVAAAMQQPPTTHHEQGEQT